MATLQRDLYNITAGTISTTGTGNRTVNFSGAGGALGTLDSAGNLISPFGLGSLLIIGNTTYPMLAVNSTSQMTAAVDLPSVSGVAYRLVSGVVPEAVIAGILQSLSFKGGANNPFPETVWDDGENRYRWASDGAVIKLFVGPTRAAGSSETAVNVVFTINPATGVISNFAWNPTAGATTVGRFARFINTAGGMAQSAMSEDGSGNIVVANTLTASQILQAVGTGDVFLRLMQTGVATWDVVNQNGTGTFAFRTGSGTAWSLSAAGALSAAASVAAPAGLFSSRVAVGTVGTLGLSLEVGGNAQFGPKTGPGVRYQVVGSEYWFTGINHDNNALNPVILSCTGSADLAVQTSGQVWFRLAPRILSLGAGTLVTDASGNVGISSDERLKDNKEKWDDGLDRVLNITPISYNWNKSSGMDRLNTYYGFSAQDVERALPEAVGMNRNGMLGVNLIPIVADLINTVKRLKDRIDAMEAG